jgi:2-polyprenyl-6-methoxyphenol hydroxylase-like FAD-dependent oxidoreductase
VSRAVVIGAGVGGLTAALALDRAGWDVTVVERAPALERVGAGIGIAANALRALDVLGLGDAVRGLGMMHGQAGVRRADGRWLTRTSGAAVEARLGDSAVLLRRSALIDLLAA